MNDITAETRIQRNPDIAFSAIDGEVVMMGSDQNAYFGLNAVGSAIWNLLDAPRKVGDLCATLMEKFEVEESRCFGEVCEFLSSVSKHKIINVAA